MLFQWTPLVLNPRRCEVYCSKNEAVNALSRLHGYYFFNTVLSTSILLQRQECARTLLRNMQQYHVCHTARSACTLVPCQEFAQKAKKLVCYKWQASSLLGSVASHIYPSSWKNPLLSLLSIENEEGGSDQQLTPEFLIEAFSVTLL
jgi:hypothetical protein